MQSIRLDQYASSERTVSEEGYAYILSVVEQYSICSKCLQYYTDQSPRVALNLCLLCVLQREGHLVFLGKKPLDATGTYYQYLSPKGKIYETRVNSKECTEDLVATLLYWQFPVPTSYEYDDAYKAGTIPLHGNYWKIYGDPKTQSALVITYTDDYSPVKVPAFLVHRGVSSYLLLDKRKKAVRDLFSQGKARLGKSASRPIDDRDVYPFIAEIAAATEEVK